ncbi:MAG: hypothetical protein DGJ47_000626 [Rickettsiaceae bacterium]
MQQITFPLTTNKYKKSDFIKSEANSQSFDSIDNWPDGQWGVPPYPKTLIVQGPKSSGKTFLAHNWVENSGAKFISLDPPFNGEVIHTNNAFIIENIDHVNDEYQLLHYFNMFNECDKYLLMTCTKLPDIKLPDLNSRLRATNIININCPDDKLIQMLIFKFFSTYSIKVKPDVISYLLNHLPRRFDAIIESLEVINQYALESKHKITIPLIKKALNS